MCGNLFFQDPAEDEIGKAGIGFDGKAGEGLPDALPLAGDQRPGFFYINMIRKQELSCQVGQGADGPGILAGKNITPERFIRGDGIAQPQSWVGPEL